MDRRFDLAWILFWGILSTLWCLTAARDLSATFDETLYLNWGMESWRSGSNYWLMRAGTMPDANPANKRAHDEAWARWLLGEIAAHAEPPAVAQAEGEYRAALARAEELGQRLLAARCHLALGALHQRVGRVEQAQAELKTAAAMYQIMELPFWQTTAEAVPARVTEVSQ